MNIRALATAVLVALVAPLTVSVPAQAHEPQPSVRESKPSNMWGPWFWEQDHGAVVKRAKKIAMPVQSEVGASVTLQRKVKGKWIKQGRTTKIVKGGVWETQAKLSFTAPSKKGVYSYRIKVGAKGMYKAGTSKTFKVYVSNHAGKSAYIKKIRKEINKYCPGVAVYIDNPRLHAGAAGMVFNGSEIYMVSGFTGSQLRYVARHECAHVVQLRKYYAESAEVSSRWNKHMKTRDKLFAGSRGSRGNELEREADCMVAVWNKVKAKKAIKHAYYQTKCSSKQLAHAKKTLIRQP